MRTRVLFSATIFLFLLVFATLSASASASASASSTFGSSKMNLIGHIANTKSDDTVISETDYVAAQDDTSVFAIVLPNSVGTSVNYTFSTNDYMMEGHGPLKDSRFFIVFTKGNKETIAKKIPEAKKGIPGKNFADVFLSPAPKTTEMFIILQYFDIDIANNLHIGKSFKKIIMKNVGIQSGLQSIIFDRI